MTQLVHMLSSENSGVQRCGADTLSKFAEYGEHELAWKSFHIADSVLEDMQDLMPKDVIMSHLVHMLSSENSWVKGSGAALLHLHCQYFHNMVSLSLLGSHLAFLMGF